MVRRFLLALVPLVALAAALLFGRSVIGPRTPAALGSFGSGPDVVLVHGLGSKAEHWLPMARDLARDHHVVLTELPGHGLAEMPQPLTLEAAARELDRAITEQCRGPVVLVGHSVGGLVAAVEALHEPARVRALVLVETALRPQLEPAERAGLLASLERDYRGTLRAAYVPFGRDSAQGLALFDGAARLDSTMLKQWIRLAVTEDLSDRIGRLRVPLLVVLSARSWPDSESWAECGDVLGYARVKDVLPVRVPGTGHFVMLDRPHLLANLVRRFPREARLSATRD
jgi:pimeloyl-ACP methyl ester carboxylesterase